MSLALTLSRRFARSRRLRASALIVAVVATVVIGMFTVLKAQSLTGAQVADRDLGRFNASAGFGLVELKPGDDTRALSARVKVVAGPSARTALILTDFSVPSVSNDAMNVQELDWGAPLPFPDHFELLAGSWPKRPGDVVIVNPSDDAPAPGRTLQLFGGRAQLRVVGTADDLFSRSPTLLVADGTWASLDPELGRTNPLLRAVPLVNWDGSRTPQVLATIGEEIGALRRTGQQPTPKAVRSTYRNRTQLEARPEISWIEETPAGYTIPSLLLPLLAALVVFTVNARLLAPSLAAMTAIGVPRRSAIAGAGLAITAWCLIASIGGALIGFGIGAAVASPLADITSNPDPPLPDVAPAIARVALITALGCGFGIAALAAARREEPRLARARPPRSRRYGAELRRGLAVALLAYVGFRALSLDQPSAQDRAFGSGAMVLAAVVAGAVLLALPDLVPALLRRLPERGLWTRLGKRLLLADRSRATALVGLLAVLIGISSGFVVLLDGLIRTATDRTVPEVLPGQVLIVDLAGNDLAPPADYALAAARKVAAIRDQDAVEMRYVRVTNYFRPNGVHGTPIAVASVADAERLLGADLSAEQKEMLLDGGALVWEGTPRRPEVRWRFKTDEGPETLGFSVAEVEQPEAKWADDVAAGLILRATAEQYEMPAPPGPLMYTGIDDADAAAVQAKLTAQGIDPHHVTIYIPPPPPIPPLALWISAVGLVILSLLVTLALMRVQVRALRGRLAHLIALGLRPRQVRLVVITQHAALLAIATVLGLLIGLPTALFARLMVPDFAAPIPWGQVGALLAAIYGSAALATLIASRNLTARSGREV